MKKTMSGLLCLVLCLVVMQSAYAVTVYDWGDFVSERHGSNREYEHSFKLDPIYIKPTLDLRAYDTRISFPAADAASCELPGMITVETVRPHYYPTPQGTYTEYCAKTYTVSVNELDHRGCLTVTEPATCLSNAYESGDCRYCEQFVRREIANTRVDHQFDSYQPLKQADCTNAATEISYCSYNCGTSDVRFVGAPDPDAHDWGLWEPTDQGTHVRICKLNSAHQQEDACESEKLCSVCKRGLDAETGLPVTGDGMPLSLCAALMLISAGLMVLIRRRRLA